MAPFILVSTRGELDFLRFTNLKEAEGYCKRMAGFGIECKMEVF